MISDFNKKIISYGKKLRCMQKAVVYSQIYFSGFLKFLVAMGFELRASHLR
jgi:hypothetical protein